MFNTETFFRVLFSFLIVLNVFGNSLVITIILKSRAMKTPMNYLLLNLAVADLMVAIFMIPVFVLNGTFTHPEGHSGKMLCTFVTGGNFTWVGSLSSIFSLVFIAIERYYAITKPLSIRYKLTTDKLKLFVPICWSVAVIVSLPEFIFAYYDKERQKCLQHMPASYSLLWLVLSAVLPISIMAVLYSRVIYQLWFKPDHENNPTRKGVRRTRKKITTMMLTLSAIYVLLWTPDSIIYVLVNYKPSLVEYGGTALNVAVFLVILNSSLNPVVYTLQFGQFRRELRKLMHCRRNADYGLSQNSTPNTLKESEREATTRDPAESDVSRSLQSCSVRVGCD